MSEMTPERALYRLIHDECDDELVCELELIVSSDAKASYELCMHFRHDAFKLGEDAISKSPYYSFLYAMYILGDRFELGEPVIATKAKESYWYATEILGGRFELGEAVMRDSKYWATYVSFLEGV